DGGARGVDGEKAQQGRFGGAAGGRALDGLRDEGTARRDLGEVRRAREQDAGRVAPVLREGGLELPHDRPLDADVGLPPVTTGAAVARPLLTDAGAAGEPDAAVDDEHAPMIAMVDSLERQRVEW